jgi:flagellar biogenesis protein FliO
MSARACACLLVAALTLSAPLRGEPTEASRPPTRAAQSSIAFRAEPALTDQLLRTGASFGLIAVAFLGTAYAYRRVQQQRLGAAGRRLKVVETLALAPKTRLFLVELDHQTILLGQHGTELSVLSNLPQPVETLRSNLVLDPEPRARQ